MELQSNRNRSSSGYFKMWIGAQDNGSTHTIQDTWILDDVSDGKYISNFTPPHRLNSQPSNVVSPVNVTPNGEAATNFNPFNTDINTVRGQETGYATLNPITRFVGTS